MNAEKAQIQETYRGGATIRRMKDAPSNHNPPSDCFRKSIVTKTWITEVGTEDLRLSVVNALSSGGMR